MSPESTLRLLDSLIRIPSVSTDPQSAHHMQDAVDLLSDALRGLGFVVRTFTTDACPPLILARYTVSHDAPTLGVYGHYDIQPEDPVDAWSSPPFTLTERDGALYGRGVADNKGHIVQNIAALSQLIATHKMTHNIVMLLEGEEETGSGHLETVLGMIPDDTLSRVDAWIVTDVGAASLKHPQIFHALRGVITGELVIRTARHDAHSGVFGNRLVNPAHLVGRIISTIHDPTTGLVSINGYYEDIAVPSPQELQMLIDQADTPDDIMRRSGAYILPPVYASYPHLSDKIPLSLASKLAPSFDINGLYSGYTGEGSKTIIPAYAVMKFSCRMVAGQSVAHIRLAVEKHLTDAIPPGTPHELTFHQGSDPFYTPIENAWMSRIAQRLETFAETPVMFNRSGGSIPAAEILQRLFRKPVILTGFTLPGDNIHAPDENFNTEMFWWGIGALKCIYG